MMTTLEKTLSIRDLMETSGVRFGTSGVRGLVSAMTDEICFAYTLAFLRVAAIPSGSRVLVAMDLRPSSPHIAAACASAIRHAGMHPVFCGAIPTPALAFHAQEQGLPGIMVTGSHIPFDRNGIKFYGLAGEITKQDEHDINHAVVCLPMEGYSMVLPPLDSAAREAYINRYLGYFPVGGLAGMRLGFYEHSSVARDLLTALLEALGAQVISLGRTDEFVPIDTEAVAEVDVERAKKWAVEHTFDAIISTDGDADRPLIGDERGQWLRGDIVGLLCARYLEAEAVATPVSCNTAIESCGAFLEVARTRIGSPYVIAQMEQMLAAGRQRVVGFEANGGFLLGSSITRQGHTLSPLMTRDAVLPVLALLAMAKGNGVALSQLTRDLPARFTGSDRLQSFPLESSRRILLELSTDMAAIDRLLGPVGSEARRLDQVDGLRIYLANGEIVHFRPSGNAPELRCYAEADTQLRANHLAAECLRLIRGL